MNALELTKKTITENNFIIGKSIRGKGTEIFSEDEIVKSYTYRFGEKELQELKDLKGKESSKDLYVYSYWKDEIWSKKLSYENQPFKLDDFIDDVAKDQSRYEYIVIKRKADVLGYLPISKYASTKESQTELCKDLLKLCDLDIYESYEDQYDLEYNDNAKKFTSDRDGIYCNDEYILVHGENTCEDTGDCLYLDGRMSDYNYSFMDIYAFDESEYLDELDPDDTISVYHRKAKDWYIGYSLNEEDMYVYYNEEDYDYDSKEDSEVEVVYFHTYKENKELIEKVKEVLESMKRDFEFECFIANELDLDYDYRRCDVNFKLVELLYSDKQEFKDDIRDSIKWDLTKQEAVFQEIYNKLINSKIKKHENFKIEFIESGEMYNHLAIIKRLEKKFNYELVYTSVIEGISQSSWAIKQDNEEYHFSIAEVIANDIYKEETLKEFIIKAIDAINSRRAKKLIEHEIYEKASQFLWA